MSTPSAAQKAMNGVHYYWVHFFTIILSTMLSTILVSSFQWNHDRDAFALVFAGIGLFTLFGGIPSSLLIERYLKWNNVWTYAAKAVLYPAAGMLLIIIFVWMIGGGPDRFLFCDEIGLLLVYPALIQSWVYFVIYSVICLFVRRSLQLRGGLDNDDESGASAE